MKKFLILPVLCGLALAACESKNNTVQVLGQNCEKIATGSMGDFVAKCPVTPEFDAIRSADKNAKFLSGGMDVINLDEIAADAESVYVDVVPGGVIEGVVANCYRFLGVTPTFDGDQAYAVEVCEQ